MNNPVADDELRDEYQLDYRLAKPNRFAARAGEAREPAAAATAGETPTGRERAGNASTGDIIRALGTRAAVFARNREAAEAQVGQSNPVIRRLFDVKMLDRSFTLVGPVVHAVDFPDHEIAVMYALGIKGDEGIGAFSYENRYSDSSDDPAVYDFIPFAECSPAVQSQMAGKINQLMTSLLREVKVAGD